MKKIRVGKSGLHGRGIFAAENIKKGEKILDIEGAIVHKSLRSERQSQIFANWVGLGKDLWLNPNKTKSRYINHSCNPSAAIAGKRTLVALRTIRAGEEITFDYSFTDADPFWHMKCKCGSSNCRKIIGPIFTIDAQTFRRRFEQIPIYFRRAYIRNYHTKHASARTIIPRAFQKSMRKYI